MRETLFALVKQCLLLGTFFVLNSAIHSLTMITQVVTGGTPLWLDHAEAFAVPMVGFINFVVWFGFVMRGLSMVSPNYTCVLHAKFNMLVAGEQRQHRLFSTQQRIRIWRKQLQRQPTFCNSTIRLRPSFLHRGASNSGACSITNRCFK